MVRIIQKENKELYQCDECDLRYAKKEWAEKCGSWCKEHQSCNIEITAHAILQEDESKKDEPKSENIKFLTKLFYGLIGVAASLVFFLALYWALRFDSTITNIITNTYSSPLYFWPYVILTIGAIVLFGVNVSLLVYRSRKFAPPKLKGHAGTGGGSLMGIAASACPVCGSTLLAAIGIAGGLAAFPLGGLELKALSLGFLALPIWFTKKDLKKCEADCKSGAYPLPKDHSFKKADRPWLAGLIALVFVLLLISWNMLKTEPIIAKAFAQSRIFNSSDNAFYHANISEVGSKFFDTVVAQVLPKKGFQSKVALGDSIVKLARNGVIDRDKFLTIYQNRGGLPNELINVLDNPLSKPILLTRENANYYVNLLWPLGLANYMESNKKSPMINDGNNVFNFASTGGWNLGKEENGGSYFNQFKIVELTPEQEALVTKIAQNSYRPCCNNSTFFQDCNHGSALLGLLQLGASQGLNENELYREALAFNSFWFSKQYIYNALYFKVIQGIDWDRVDPKVVMGKDFSSGSGSGNIQAEVANIPNLIPQEGHGGGAGCGTE